MPELPDLEVFIKNLKPLILDKKIENVNVIKNKVIGKISPSEFNKKLISKKIVEINRRGKFQIYVLSTKEKFFIHLMLHGEMVYINSSVPLNSFTCVCITFEDKNDLRFQDRTQWMKLSFDSKLLDGLGIEPLSKEFTIEVFISLLKSKRGSIKQFLMDQSKIAGIGNAFADEILFNAKIFPKRDITEIRENEKNRLYNSMKNVLSDSIKKVEKGLHKGITGEIRDFCNVHGKDGKRCPVCGNNILKMTIAGRGTYYCSECQDGGDNVEI